MNNLSVKKNTLVNLSSSLLAHYGAKYFHPTNKMVDKILKGHQKVAVFLLDGSGSAILSIHPNGSKELLKHKVTELKSVRPATTVASTTAFLTGKYPIETGWLGWSIPFKEYSDRNVSVFPNRFQDDRSLLPIPDAMWKKCPITTLDKLIQDAGHKAFLNFPIHINKVSGYIGVDDAFLKASSYFKEGGEFLYTYIEEPDHSIHDYGVRAPVVGKIIKDLTKKVISFAKKNKDVLVLVIADHGLVNVEERDINDYPSLKSKLARAFSIEGRTPAFKCLEGEKEAFKEEFNSLLGEDFDLKSADEILEMGYFGEGEVNPNSLYFIGDYVAISKTKAILVDKTLASYSSFKAHHAGESKAERRVNLAAWNL